MEKQLRNKGAWDKLTELAESIKICMLCTTDISGNMRSRPMVVLDVDENGDLWFFANRLSDLCLELGEEGLVCLSFSHPAKDEFLSVSGHAVIIRDKIKNKELWSSMLKTWFPNGHNDPELILIRVSPSTASYWDNDVSKMVELFSYLKAAVTGRKYAEGEHGQLEL
ncbi:MAG TPA: pyridoxamine 5'-phosphate oxidase family protein [Bacteroidia bacterium]|nr:pyridoxamine 5'-phosphate oxidase family protein [Bacteroidia bacterium]